MNTTRSAPQIHEPDLFLDKKPIATRLPFRYNENKIEEEKTMTIRDLALNLIEHADTTPETIDIETAAQYLSWLDPDSDLPEDLSPEPFMEAWNEIVQSGQHEDNWTKLD